MKMKWMGAGCLALALSACHEVVPPELSGRLTGLEKGTLWIESAPLIDASNVQTDTIALDADGDFRLTYGDGMPRTVCIWGMPANGKDESDRIRIADLLLLPEHPARVEGTPTNNVWSGDPFYEDCAELSKRLSGCITQIDSLKRLAASLEAAGAKPDRIGQVFQPALALLDEMSHIRIDYVHKHLDRDAALYALLSDIPIDTVGPLLESLAASVRIGRLSTLYKRLENGYEREMQRRVASERISEGNLAPDFALKDWRGNEFALVSQRGKYVVLHFWGSWCNWSLHELPDMKKAYEQYQSRVEFVGINCRDTEEKWRAALKEYEQPWPQVRNGGYADQVDVAMLYGVQTFPTKIIVNTHGKIVKIFTGETPAFFDYLRRLFD